MSAASAFKGWKLDGFEIKGLDGNLADPIKEGLALAGENKLFGHDYPDFYPAMLEADLERAGLFLRRMGYPYATITPEFKPDSKDRAFELTLRVEPGPPVRIGTLRYDGWPEGSDRPGGSVEEGDVFRDDEVRATAVQMREKLRERGHAQATVDFSVSLPDSTHAQIVYDVRPGEVFWFGETRIRGVPGTMIDLVDKQIDIEAGSRYSPVTLRRAKERLQLLDLFRRVELTTEATADDTLAIVAELARREMRSFEVGGGYWTDELFRGHARWRHRNLFEQGRGLEARVAGSQFEQSAGVSVWWYSLFLPRTRSSLSADFTREDEESYRLLTTELQLATTYRLALATTAQAAIAISNVDVTSKTDDPEAFLERGGALTVLSALWRRNTTDDRLYPTSGFTSWVRSEWAPPGALSSAHFILGEAYFAYFRDLGSRVVSATRIDVGLARPVSPSEDLLPNRRFFAGGAASMRGFKRRQLGPQDREGAPIGGEAKLELSTEVRIPIWWRFTGAVWVDAAQVWLERDDLRLDELELAVGPTLMFETPVGPVRAEVGFRITDLAPDEPERVFHLTIGHPY